MSHEPELARFRELLRVPTVSGATERAERADPFGLIRAAIRRLYPRIETELQREVVLGRTLLYRWSGRAATAPTVLMAHQDVLPGPDDGGEHPPFAAEVEDDGDGLAVWGRGAVHAKGMLAALLEALESALEDGVVPEQDVYLVLGHDGEADGRGAGAVAELLRARGVTPALVLDAGGAIVEGVIPGVSGPLAMIGISERGVADVELSAVQPSGRVSSPPRRTAAGRVARAVVRLESRTAPSRMPVASALMLETVAARADGARSFAYRHARRLRPLLAILLARGGDEAVATVRSTRAITRLRASESDSVLADRVEASVSLRVGLGSTVDRELRRIERTIADPEVVVRARRSTDPSPVSAAGGPAWGCLVAMLGEHRPDAIPTPFVLLGSSDSRFLATSSPNVYRFSPFALTVAQRRALGTANERIGVASWSAGVRMLRTLLSSL